MGIDTKFWKGKKVLVTGHTGFKGSWLSLWLQKLGTDLVGFSKDVPTTPSLYELADVGKGMTSVIGDIRNYKQVEDLLKKNEPEIVIHLAAQAILRRSYQDPVETYSTNVMGTVNVLEAVRKSSSVKVVLNVTSDKCYQVKNSSEGYREDNPMGGFDPYSNSKGCAELVTSSYRNSFFNQNDYDKHGISLASARAGNVIGGGDWGSDRLVPDIMRGILGGKEITIRNPNSVRPWQYILDPLRGYLVLIEKLWENGSNFSEGWNFGPITNDLKPVSWIVEKLSKLWEEEISWKVDKNENPHEEQFLKLDCSKAKSKLGWSSKMNIESSLEWTVEWYRKYKEGKNMKEVSENQINDFIAI